MRKQNVTRKTKLTPVVLMMIKANYSDAYISSTLALSTHLIKQIKLEFNLPTKTQKVEVVKVKEVSSLRKKQIKREQEILDMLNTGATYIAVGEKFNISKARVQQIAKKHNIKRWDVMKEKREKLESTIINDFESGLTYKEIKEKNGRANIKIDGESLYNIAQRKRNIQIVSDYKVNTATSIIKSTNRVLINPNKLSTVGSIYKINKKMGYKKYPNIGNRTEGGLFEDKKVIKFIKEKRDKNKLPFSQICVLLNQKGWKTPMGKEYSYNNVRLKYESIIKNKL